MKKTIHVIILIFICQGLKAQHTSDIYYTYTKNKQLVSVISNNDTLVYYYDKSGNRITESQTHQTAISPVYVRAATPVSCYPNPASSICNIEFMGHGSIATIGIYDVHGRSVRATQQVNIASGNNIIPVNTDDLVNGTYMVQICFDNQSSFVKIVVMRE